MEERPDPGILERQAAPRWVRGEGRIENGEIVLVRGEPYDLTPDPEHSLLWDLAGLKTDAERARDFCAHHGLLWHDEDGAREVLVTWQRVSSDLNVLLEAKKALGERDDDRRRQRVHQSYSELQRVSGVSSVSSVFGKGTPEDWTADEWRDLESVVAVLLGAIVSDRVRKIHRLLLPRDGSPAFGAEGFELIAEPADLEILAYWQLAEILTTNAPVYPCPQCGRYFEAGHKLQKYCSDRCAQRARYERWKARKEEEEP